MLCLFQVYNKVIQLYICIFFFRFFSIISYYKILNIVRCAISRSSLSIYFICSSVLSVNPILLIYLPPSPLVTISLSSMSVSLFLFCK